MWLYTLFFNYHIAFTDNSEELFEIRSGTFSLFQGTNYKNCCIKVALWHTFSALVIFFVLLVFT